MLRTVALRRAHILSSFLRLFIFQLDGEAAVPPWLSSLPRHSAGPSNLLGGITAERGEI